MLFQRLIGLLIFLLWTSILWFGMGIVTHLVVMPTPPDLGVPLSWIVILAWPGIWLALALVIGLILAVAVLAAIVVVSILS